MAAIALDPDERGGVENLDQAQIEILEYLDREGDQLVPSAPAIAAAIAHDPIATADDLVLLESLGLVVAEGSENYAVRDCRFHPSRRGTALLASRRKGDRERTRESTSITDIARDLIRNDVMLSREKLGREVQNPLARCAANGVNGGAMIAAVEQVVVQEMRARADTALATLGRVVERSATRFTSEELIGAYNYATSDDMFGDARKYVIDAASITGSQTIVVQRGAAIQAVESQIRAKTLAELGLSATHSAHQVAQEPLLQSNAVFVVHGHNAEMKEAIARTLMKLKLECKIPHELPNQGRTIIEKFEEVDGSVQFAVVALSADDVLTDEGGGVVKRPRQNVIFELGYFIGKLGRSRVVALVPDLPREQFEYPSDYDGVLYTKYDKAGHWRFDLVKELKAAGYQVSADDLL